MRLTPPRLRWLPLAAVVWLVLGLVIVAPTADLLAFGIHEHVTAPDDTSRDLAGPDNSGPPAHHCELSASPAGLALALVLSAPGPIAVPVVETRVSASDRTPSVPLGPPRG